MSQNTVLSDSDESLTENTDMETECGTVSIPSTTTVSNLAEHFPPTSVQCITNASIGMAKEVQERYVKHQIVHSIN